MADKKLRPDAAKHSKAELKQAEDALQSIKAAAHQLRRLAKQRQTAKPIGQKTDYELWIEQREKHG